MEKAPIASRYKLFPLYRGTCPSHESNYSLGYNYPRITNKLSATLIFLGLGNFGRGLIL